MLMKKLLQMEQNILRLSFIKLINDLLGEVKIMLAKTLTKDLINGYSIANAAKYFVEDGSLFSISTNL